MQYCTKLCHTVVYDTILYYTTSRRGIDCERVGWPTSIPENPKYNKKPRGGAFIVKGGRPFLVFWITPVLYYTVVNYTTLYYPMLPGRPAGRYRPSFLVPAGPCKGALSAFFWTALLALLNASIGPLEGSFTRPLLGPFKGPLSALVNGPVGPTEEPHRPFCTRPNGTIQDACAV